MSAYATQGSHKKHWTALRSYIVLFGTNNVLSELRHSTVQCTPRNASVSTVFGTEKQKVTHLPSAKMQHGY